MSVFDHGHDQGGAALLEERSHGKERRSSSHATPLPAVAFPLPSSRLIPCVVKLVSAAGLAGLSAYLVAEIPRTPGLTTNIAVLSIVGAIGAVALVVLAVRDAVCRLVVDDQGARITPFPFGQSVEWSQIASWRMSDESNQHAVGRQLMFWVRGTSFPRLLAVGRLSDDARHRLRKALHARLGDES